MTNTMQNDVLVVGGGPAGLAAAIAARRRGMRVLIVDRALPPIDKACGEGLMPDSLAALAALGLDLTAIPAGRLRGIRFIDSEHSVEAQFPRGYGAGMRRTALHRLLLGHAAQAGVEMRWGVRLTAGRNGIRINGDPADARWIVGADGQQSLIRSWAGLDAGSEYARRFGWRRHFRVEPWSEYVEVYWGDRCELYISPSGRDEVCVALLTGRRDLALQAAIAQFPALAARLHSAQATSPIRGALTGARRLRRVIRPGVALIGEASGSVDAITGEGLGMCFRQALALGEALAGGDIERYQQAHRSIRRRPQLMASAMLMLDRHPQLRRRALRALATHPATFARLLAFHVGQLPAAQFAALDLFGFAWRLVSA
jgi:flavin-dependent dehydrogenase